MTTRDPRRNIKHIDTYFGVRNNIKGKPIENVNYTVETLSYMTSHNRADQITELIVDRMKRTNNPIPFIMFECCGGLGGNTLSFLENPNTQWVATYELNLERREMLRRNVSMYDLSSKSHILDEGFTGVKKGYKGVVLYFDPPWLPADIKGHESTKDQYILSGMKIGGKTLEGWVTDCSNCAMVVMRVPPGYKLDPIPGYDVEPILLKNSLVLIATPKGSVNPVVEKTLIDGVEKSELEWYQGLKTFIYDTLEPIVPSEEHRKLMISDEAMKTWVPCFTHESYNINVGMNYEQLEFVGDHAMEYNFVLYMYMNYPNISESELNNLKSHYISKAFQAEIGNKMRFGDWVRIRVRKNTHIFEDLVEAFFGGLNIVGNEVFKFGAGTGLCFNMIIKIFEDVPINMIYSKGKPKSVIKETFETLHWGKAVEEYHEGPNRTTVASVSLTPEAVAGFATMNVKITDLLLASASGSTKKVAFGNAYEGALIKLRKMGISEELVDSIRKNKDFNNPDLQVLMNNAKQKVVASGYSSFYIHKAQVTKEGNYYQVIGVKPNKKLDILETSNTPLDDLEGKKLVLNMYLNK